MGRLQRRASGSCTWNATWMKWWVLDQKVIALAPDAPQISCLSLCPERRREQGSSSGSPTGRHLFTSLCLREKRRSERESGVPGGRRGLSRLGCINPEFDSQSPALRIPALTFSSYSQHASLHTCVSLPPTSLSHPPDLCTCICSLP